MKKFILILFLAGCSVLTAQVDNLMQRANKFYQEEKYDDALKAYKDILNRGYISPALYFNLGNTYFRTGQLGYAILNYERALKLAPNDEDIKYNLSLVNARTIDRIQDVPKLFITEWWEMLLTSITINAWSVLVSSALLLLLISLGLYFTAKTGRIQRYGFLSGSAFFAILIALAIILFSAVNRELSTDFGVTIESEIAAKQSPDEKSSDVFVIHEGLKFEVQDQVNNWSKIRLSDGKIGWLPKSAFEII